MSLQDFQAAQVGGGQTTEKATENYRVFWGFQIRVVTLEGKWDGHRLFQGNIGEIF